MQTLEALNKKIGTAEDLLTVVKTMKALAAVNIRQYQKAVESLDSYKDVVEKGWQVLLRYGDLERGSPPGKDVVFIVIGTDQGMCGQFNENIAAKAFAEAKLTEKEGMNVCFWSVGEKIAAALADRGVEVQLQYQAPGSLHAVNITVNDLTEKLEDWKITHGTEIFYLFHNILAGIAGYDQAFYALLPLDRNWIDARKKVPWPGKCMPLLGLPKREMFAQLFRQYLFILLHRGLVQSLAGENSARLAAMQAAEKNIAELGIDLRKLYREKRQMNITTELLDIISGFEALSNENSRSIN